MLSASARSPLRALGPLNGLCTALATCPLLCRREKPQSKVSWGQDYGQAVWLSLPHEGLLDLRLQSAQGLGVGLGGRELGRVLQVSGALERTPVSVVSLRPGLGQGWLLCVPRSTCPALRKFLVCMSQCVWAPSLRGLWASRKNKPYVSV